MTHRTWGVMLLVLTVAVSASAVAAGVGPNVPISCDNVEPYVCGEYCLGYHCSPPAPDTDLCKERFAGEYSCIYWPGHRCCSGWFANF